MEHDANQQPLEKEERRIGTQRPTDPGEITVGVADERQKNQGNRSPEPQPLDSGPNSLGRQGSEIDTHGDKIKITPEFVGRLLDTEIENSEKKVVTQQDRPKQKKQDRKIRLRETEFQALVIERKGKHHQYGCDHIHCVD